MMLGTIAALALATAPLDLDATTRDFLSAPSFRLEQSGVADACAGPLPTALSFVFDDAGGGTLHVDDATVEGVFTIEQAHVEHGRLVLVIADPAAGAQTKTLGFDKFGDPLRGEGLQVVDTRKVFVGPGSLNLDRYARFVRCTTPPR